ncbi:hypothetical protein COJ27_29280 [Bacillus cereus]|uniref:hypothetical protein n=1 Tax=Bacillus cereus TaxID=1396 RepID=UPI000BF7EBE8|nr:hypothetical protein [Bacillus cereus]PFL57694.1 hypothetical protein COJ27_29280 [Bacillus cereus]
MPKKRFKQKKMKLYHINNGWCGASEICVIAESEWRARKIAEKHFKEEAKSDYCNYGEEYWTRLNIYLESEDTTKESIAIIPS